MEPQSAIIHRALITEGEASMKQNIIYVGLDVVKVIILGSARPKSSWIFSRLRSYSPWSSICFHASTFPFFQSNKRVCALHA